jgi:hypothetical protein
MFKVGFDNLLLDIHLAWKVFANIPFHKGASIPLFTVQEFWDASIWNINKLNVHLIFLSMSYLKHPHQVFVCEGGILCSFVHEWNEILEPFS